MRRLVVLAGWLWGLVALPHLTDAGVDFLWGPTLFFNGGLVGLMWVTYSAAVPGVFRSPRTRWAWMSVPAIGLAGVLLASTHRDLAVRVWLCESTLTEYAESIRRTPDAARRIEYRRVGLFEVQGTTADENEVLLYTAGSGFMDSAGLVYRPDGSRPQHTRRVEHLYGPWWWFFERF